MTFNLYHGGIWSGWSGDAAQLERRLDRAAAELGALGADVIALQEASAGAGRGNVAARLAARLGLHDTHAPAFDGLPAALLRLTEGPALLSRFPIRVAESWELPRCGRPFEPRVLLHAELATPWGPLSVFSTHTAGDPCHTARVAELVRARRGRLPALLMGDFNATEDSPAIGTLTVAAGFLDAFRAANPAAPGPTVWQPVGVRTPLARRRVDYVFVVPGRESTGHVVASRVVLNTPEVRPDGSALWASDHYGVLATVELAPANPGGVTE